MIRLPHPAAWLLLGVLLLLYLLVGVLKTAFRGLGRVAAENIVQRGPGRNGSFLRKSLREETPLWYSLQIAGALCLISVAGTLVTGSLLAGRGGALLSVLTALGWTLAIAIIFEFALPALIVRDDEERIVEAMLRVLQVVHVLLFPLSAALAWIDTGSVWGEKPGVEDEPADEEELEAFIEMGEEEGILEEQEKELIRGVVEFGDAVAREVMTPRTDVIAVAFGDTLADVRRVMAEAMHTRLPVYDGSIDSIRGIIHMKDLINIPQEEEGSPVEQHLRPVSLAPESMKVHDLLRLLQERRLSMAVIVDEYGGTAGIVTVEDLIEEIVGEIQDEHETEEEWIVREPNGELTVDGRLELDALSAELGEPLESEEVETIGGLVFSQLGYLPRIGESVVLGACRYHVLEADEKRIYRLRVEPMGSGNEAHGEGS